MWLFIPVRWMLVLMVMMWFIGLRLGMAGCLFGIQSGTLVSVLGVTLDMMLFPWGRVLNVRSSPALEK